MSTFNLTSCYSKSPIGVTSAGILSALSTFQLCYHLYAVLEKIVLAKQEGGQFNAKWNVHQQMQGGYLHK